MKTLIKALLLLLATQSLACERYVVLDPDKVAQKNSQNWTIQQEPQPAPARTGP
ncbi:MAG: hypothetical protein ACJ8AT_28285 [Hyalangium sp.]|uniref:hypothetical protein n=1 Tax=Hyalangium sp. TaxID=2028555 RepID=UPI00389A30A2